MSTQKEYPYIKQYKWSSRLQQYDKPMWIFITVSDNKKQIIEKSRCGCLTLKQLKRQKEMQMGNIDNFKY